MKKKMFFAILAAVLASSLVLSGCKKEEEEESGDRYTSTIHGTVYDYKTGSPLPNAVVEFGDMVQFTGSNGIFSFSVSNYKSVFYELYCEKDGYKNINNILPYYCENIYLDGREKNIQHDIFLAPY